MPTITTIVKTKDHYGIGSITCGPKILSDGVVFFPPNTFGVLQALSHESNNQRVMDIYRNGGTFDHIHDGDEKPQWRQYLFFQDDNVITYTGERIKNVYENYDDNIIVLANSIGSKQYGDSFYNSLKKNYSDDLVDCITRSLKENVHVGFDLRCEHLGISSTTVYVAVYERGGKNIFSKEIYSIDSEPIDKL
jgi:hypothetical protein